MAVCVLVFQASMMSAENDPLGPLPPGWGKFVLDQVQYMLFGFAVLLTFSASLCGSCQRLLLTKSQTNVRRLTTWSFYFYPLQRSVWTPMTECTLWTITPKQRSGKTLEPKGELRNSVSLMSKRNKLTCFLFPEVVQPWYPLSMFLNLFPCK